MPKKLTRLQQQDLLIAHAEKRLREIGATPDPDSRADWMHPHVIDTVAGKLRPLLSRSIISPGREPADITIFTKFDKPEEAKKWRDCNPFTGKWNHHCLKTTEDIDGVIADIERLLPVEQVA